jgi:hypothetical protein
MRLSHRQDCSGAYPAHTIRHESMTEHRVGNGKDGAGELFDDQDGEPLHGQLGHQLAELADHNAGEPHGKGNFSTFCSKMFVRTRFILDRVAPTKHLNPTNLLPPLEVQLI